MATTGPKPFGNVSAQYRTMAQKLRQHRQQEARRHAISDLDVFFQKQRQRVTITLREAGKRVEKARRGGEYGDEVIVTDKRA